MAWEFLGFTDRIGLWEDQHGNTYLKDRDTGRFLGAWMQPAYGALGYGQRVRLSAVVGV